MTTKHTATIKWKCQVEEFTFKTYNRTHQWDFENGITVNASAPVEYMGDIEMVNPEQAFTASISSCQLLTFLAIAAKQGYLVETYEDQATGIVDKNSEGKLAMTEVILKPRVTFSGDKIPDSEQLAKLHDQAHRYCLITNSIYTEIKIA